MKVHVVMEDGLLCCITLWSDIAEKICKAFPHLHLDHFTHELIDEHSLQKFLEGKK